MKFSSVITIIVSIVTNVKAFRLSSQAYRAKTNHILSLSAVECKPGSPIVKKVDSESNIAFMTVAISGEDTQKAFTKAVEMFNEEVKNKEYKVAGFRPGAKLPASYLYQMFGEDQVKLFCGTLLAEEIQDECEKTGLRFVGRGRITQFNELAYNPGKPHVIDIECDIWPEITFDSPTGYKGLKVTVVKSEFDSEKYENVKLSILERYKVLNPTEPGYQAKMGDVVVANMRGYESNPDGTKGKALPSVASGDTVEILLEAGKYMPGLIEGVTGCKGGETKTIDVQFPVRPGGAGAALSGKKAIFDIEVTAVKTKSLPKWDEELAERVRPGLVLAELEKEVRQAVEGEKDSQTENVRNDALAKALGSIAVIKKVPDSLVQENIQSKFQQMLMDFKEQGSTEEQLKEMTTLENFEKYTKISKAQAEKTVILSMVFREIAEREKIIVTPEEIKSQIDLLSAQAKQKGEQMPDVKRVSEEIENVLLRKKVFDFIAEHSDITWLDSPSSPAA